MAPPQECNSAIGDNKLRRPKTRNVNSPHNVPLIRAIVNGQNNPGKDAQSRRARLSDRGSGLVHYLFCDPQSRPKPDTSPTDDDARPKPNVDRYSFTIVNLPLPTCLRVSTGAAQIKISW
jgi:hypothetical protein